MVSESTLPVKPGDQPPPALSQIPPATGCPPTCPVIGRIAALGYVASRWASEHGAAWVHAWATGTPPTIGVPVCHQPDGAVIGFQVCHVSLVTAAWPDRLGSNTRRPWYEVLLSVAS